MGTEDHESEASPSLSRDTVHDLLANRRRRAAIACLREHGSLALPDLADEIARREHDAPLPEIPEDDVLRVYLSLWHVHVPKLSEASVVSYDQDSDVVALAENAGPLEQFLSPEPSTDEESERTSAVHADEHGSA